jgi:16S rRNA (uracil1498-N3)-methyltransferase
MNVILFEPDEIGKPLSRFDPRGEHVLKVLKKKEGERFEAGIVDGSLGEAVLDEIGEKQLRFSFNPIGESPSLYPVRIVIGFPRPIVLRRLLKDLSTLGVESISLAAGDTGEKSYLDSNFLKGKAPRDALVDGAMQGFTTRLPSLSVYPSLDRYLASLASLDESPGSRVCLDNRDPETRFSGLEGAASPMTVAVGSERGWSDRERGLFAKAGFVSAGLGDRVLRTETACTVAVILALEKLGII